MTTLQSLRAGRRPTQWAIERAIQTAEILCGSDVAFAQSSAPLIERVADLLDAERADLYEELIALIPTEDALTDQIRHFVTLKILENNGPWIKFVVERRAARLGITVDELITADRAALRQQTELEDPTPQSLINEIADILVQKRKMIALGDVFTHEQLDRASRIYRAHYGELSQAALVAEFEREITTPALPQIAAKTGRPQITGGTGLNDARYWANVLVSACMSTDRSR